MAQQYIFFYIIMCRFDYSHTHSDELREVEEGSVIRVRVIVRKDAEPPDLTSRNSSVTASLSTPITEQ